VLTQVSIAFLKHHDLIYKSITMKTNFLIALILGVFVTYIGSSVSLADFVIDDFQNASITAAPNEVTVSTSSTGAMSVTRVASGGEGYEIAFDKAGVALATATITYSFTNGLRSLFPGSYTGASKQSTPVLFHIPIFLKNVTEGTFTVSASQFFNSGTPNPVVTPISPSGTSNSMLEINTGKTIGGLETNDLTAIQFNFEYTGSFLGLSDQTMILGGGSGVNPGGRVGSFTAIPEPTSAAMIGCALVGLIARRRRKA
jgi:hypothetical protein